MKIFFLEDCVSNSASKLTETEEQREGLKLPSSPRQDITNWIAEGINCLKNHPDMIENSLRVYGITTNYLGKVRNDEFLKKIVNSLKNKLADEEEELLDDKDPFSCV